MSCLRLSVRCVGKLVSKTPPRGPVTRVTTRPRQSVVTIRADDRCSVEDVEDIVNDIFEHIEDPF